MKLLISEFHLLPVVRKSMTERKVSWTPENLTMVIGNINERKLQNE